jgi:type II secretory ATPase GspE/PulE/Tfp pilus assembly ATPase PilB-like protein
MPPFASYPPAEPQREPLAVEIEGRSGNLMSGLLVALEPAAGIARVQVPPDRVSLPMRFDQIRRITLQAPILPLSRREGLPAPDEPLSEEQARVLEHHPAQPFTVHLAGGGSFGGVTVGHVEDEVGLFLFMPLDDRGAVQCSLLPRAAYDRAVLGERLGALLVEEAAVTPAQVEQAMQIQKRSRGQKLGEILVARQIVTPDQLLAALDKQARMPMVRLGEALVALGYLREEQLHEVLGQQVSERVQPLGEVLLGRDWVTPQQLRVAMARKMGYPVVNLTNFHPQNEALALLPLETARVLEVLPLVHRAGRLVVAMQDVSRQAVLEQLAELSGCAIAPALAGAGDLKAAIERAYADLPVPVDPGTTPEAGEAPAVAPSVLSASESARGGRDDPVQQLLVTLVADAMGKGASAIHIENHPSEDKLWVRLRRDGRMEPHTELPGRWRTRLVARVKSLAELDGADSRRPQSGRLAFARLMPQHRIELRVTTLPTHGGMEDVVIGLPTRLKALKFEGLGLVAADQERLGAVLARSGGGLILGVGPAGSGRTTTLLAELSRLNQPERKIVSLGERLEATLPGVRQIEVDARAGRPMAAALQAVLQADADVIAIDGLRDVDSAQLALEAAAAGRLVLATATGRNTAEAVQRLLDLGVDRWLLGDTLQVVHAQRLMRRLCSSCRMSRSAREPEIAEWIEGHFHGSHVDAAEAAREQLRADWLARHGRDGKLRRYHSAGCERCRDTGLRGRAAAHELMFVSRELRRLIRAGAPAWNLQRLALQEGLRTLRQDAVEKMLAGLVSLDEVRAVGD